MKEAVRELAAEQPDAVHPCDCCGSRASKWDEALGEHTESHFGPNGPFAFNGGLPFCCIDPWVKKLWGGIFLKRCATASSVAEAAQFADQALELLDRRQLIRATAEAHDEVVVSVDGKVCVVGD